MEITDVNISYVENIPNTAVVNFYIRRDGVNIYGYVEFPVEVYETSIDIDQLKVLISQKISEVV